MRRFWHGDGARLARAVAAAIAAVCGLVGAPGIAAASWEPAAPVDNAASGYGPTAGANALTAGSGVATGLFFQQAPGTPSGAPGSPFAIRRGATGTWSAPAAVPMPAGKVDDFAGPALAAGPGGGTLGVFAFDPSGGGVQTLLTSWPAGGAAPGTAGPVLCTSGSSPECAAITPQVGIDGSGNAYAVASISQLSGDVLFSRTDPATGAWEPAQVVGQGTDPELAVDSSGDVVITYARPDPSAPSASVGPFYRLYAKREPAGGATFGAEQLISGPDDTIDNVAPTQTALVIDGAGNATAAFPQGTVLATGGPPNSAAIFVARWAQGAAPQAAQELTAQAHGNGGHAALAVDPQGRVTAAWDVSTTASAVYAAQYASGSWSAAQQVSPANSMDSYLLPALAADADGTVTLAYLDQPNPFAGEVLDAERKPAGGPWSAPAVLSDTVAGAGSVRSLSHHVAAANPGQADVTFVQQLNGTDRLFATRFDDTTPPLITITTPQNGATYGQGTTVLADYSCAEEPGGSGVASCQGPVPNGTPIDTRTPGPKTFTVTAGDQAGNTSSKTVDYNVKAGPPPKDTTPPSITITTPQNGATYTQGTTVRARYACAEEPGGSGVASCQGTVPNGRPINTRTPGRHIFSVIAQDQAGNASSKTVYYNVKAGPSITITTPQNGATYTQGTTVRARYACAEEPGGSGVASCQGTVPNGRPINTRTPGRHIFSVIAQDRAGNTDSKTVRYTVAPRIRLAVRPRRATTGHRVRFGFRATVCSRRRCHGLGGVLITFNRRRARTDRHGNATIITSFRRSGHYRARAHKRGYRDGTATVTVRR